MTERLLMALRGEEAEPVLIETDGSSVVLTLDDGEVLIFDRQELSAVIDERGERLARIPA